MKGILLEELHVTNTLLSPGLVASALVEHGLTIDEQLGTPERQKHHHTGHKNGAVTVCLRM